MFTRKDLVKLLLPLIVEQLLAVLVGMADVVMVAAVGETAVSGVSLVDSISILIIQMLAALATGGSVVCAQYIGKKQPENACEAAGQLILITTMVSAVIAVVALLGNRHLLSMIFGKVEDSVMENAQIYFWLSALSYPFLAVYNSCAALYRAMGNSKVSMYASLVMNAINIAEIVPKESKKAVPLEETKMQELFRAIHVGDQEKIRKEAIKETEKLHKNAATISQYNLATMEIVSGFFKFCANNSMDFNEISGNVQNLYERVTQLDESSMTNWIINMSMAISEKLRSTRNSTSRRIITDAQNIVKDRYMEPALSLDDVCADLGVSNSYFSSIFKKETGQSFVSYLTDYRMDRAEEMVLNTDEKSYKIAEKVGYQDANYFSYVFKKKFGVSPSKYRASGK